MDITGRFISKVFPWHEQLDVPLNRKIEITFAHHMKKETVEHAQAVQLWDSTSDLPVSGTVYAFSGPTRKLTIHSGDLKPGRTYQIIIPHEGDVLAETIQGNTPPETYLYTFATEGQYMPEKEPTNTLMNDNEDLPSESENSPKVLFDPFSEVPDQRVRLLESYPQNGDLMEPSSEMVFVFEGELEEDDVKDHIFVKRADMSPLLERLRGEQLIKGTVKKEASEPGQSLFVFTPSQALSTGSEYQAVLSKKISQSMKHDARITFHTLFERMFIDVPTVRLVLGRFADRLSDLELAKLINQQSNSVYQLASMMDSFDEADWQEENGVIVRFPYAAGQYVVYSTAYYAILGQSLETSSGISESIRLADLSVAGSSEVSDSLSDLLAGLKAEYERWWSVLQGEPEEIEPGTPNPNYRMGTTTRGGSTPYPEFQTRVPFEDIGGGGG